MKKICSFALCLMLVTFSAGCTSIRAIETNFATVDFSNGIGSDESIFIAKKELVDKKQQGKYKVGSGAILVDHFVRSYPDHWFIQFGPKSFDHSFWRYLVVIDRTTGVIEYSGEYVPLEVIDYDWVFEK